MSKPIKLTDDLIAKYVGEFEANLRSQRMHSGKLKFEKSITWDAPNDKVNILFTADAYVKMITLIQKCTDEVGWHGVIKRSEDDPCTFIVSDILVFPQVVTGATVTPDQLEYDTWLMTQPDGVFEHIRFHGHSHVRMAVSPSTTDIEYQMGKLKDLPDDDFYVFMIWNKMFDFYALVYDMENNTVYETKEVSIGLLNGGSNLTDFMKDAEEKVVKKTYTNNYGGNYGGSYGNGRPNYPSYPRTPVGGTTPKSSAPATGGDDKSKGAAGAKSTPYPYGAYGDYLEEGYPPYYGGE